MKSRKQIERLAKVMKFLKDNPLSTADEIYAATGIGVLSVAGKLVNQVKYEGKTVWRIRQKALQEGAVT